MSILADTNTLLRRTQPDHPGHVLAVESVARLLTADEPVYFTLQNISEFWNVATRPVANNGMGFSVALVLAEVDKIERFLTVLPDSPAVYSEWKRLLVRHGVLGSKVHDAKLVGHHEHPRHPPNSYIQYRRFHALRYRCDSSLIAADIAGDNYQARRRCRLSASAAVVSSMPWPLLRCQ